MKIVKTKPEHIKEIVRISVAAFDSDVAVGAPSLGGPPYYDSISWHNKMMNSGNLISAVDDGKIIGAALIFPDKRDESMLYIGRIFIDPLLFHKGYGRKLMQLIETTNPKYTKFYLDTPIWNVRTNSFYTKMAYREIRRDTEFVYYEKLIMRTID